MAASSGIDRNICGGSRTDFDIARLAARQHNRVARRQLLALDFSEDQIDYRIRIGRLHPVALGVYAAGAVVDTPDARRMTAVLEAGEKAALTSRSGLSLHGVGDGWWKGFELIAPREVDRKGLSVKRIVLPEDELTEVRGIPVTIAPHSILDAVAAVKDLRYASRVINEVERLRIYDSLSLVDLIERHPRHRGRRLAEKALALDDTAFTMNEFEEEGLRWVRSLPVPEPQVNEWVRIGGKRRKPDLSWLRERVAGEFDSYSFHAATRADWESDRARDAAYGAAGWVLFPITWRRLMYDREALGAELVALVEQRAALQSQLER